MKSCPECLREYQDDSLVYCLDDGSRLASNEFADEPETAFIMPPSGVPPPRAAEPSGTSRPRSVAPLLAGVVVLAAIAYLAYAYLVPDPAGRIDSIAVMPFVNQSGNPEIEYLSDGLTESLISSLSQLRELAVKPRSSVFRFKGKEADAGTLGKELGVQTILTGSVAQRGGEIGLYVELVDAGSDRVIWSKDYKRPLSGLVALQSEVARDVSSELRTRVSGADERQLTKTHTSNPEAYQLYLKGRFHWNKRTKNDLYKAIDYYRQAVSLDPNYAMAYAGIADTYLLLPGYDFELSRLELGAKARENALRALALDDSLAQAHISLGLLFRSLDHNFAEAERHLRRGLELDPANADGYNYLAYMQTAFGKFGEAEANYKRAIDLEPTSPNHIRNYAGFLLYNRRYDESLAQLKKAVDLEPNFVLAHLTMSNVYQTQGKYAEAVESYAKAREVLGDPAVAALMRESFSKGGWKGFINGLNEKRWFEEYRPLYIRAIQLASIGDNERAIAELERAYEERDGFIILLNVDPRLDPLRGDPRFQALVKKIGVG
jgi:TolB-like protein/tetratricopeptide (TPR) repeat protein